MQPSEITLVVQIFQGLLTPVIAVVMVYIAWQQWKANERKLVLERYDRRLKIYQEVVSTLTLVLGNLKPEITDLQRFRSATAEADFLFESEISEYIADVFKRGVLLWQANFEYCDYTKAPPPGYDHQKVVNQMHEQTVWFSKQYDVAKQKFKKYLDISR